MSLSNMGKMAYLQGDYEQAEALIREGVMIAYQINYNYVLGLQLSLLAGPLAATGQAQKGARLIGAAAAYYEATGIIPQQRGGSDLVAERIRETSGE